jgi:peroxiredoxin
VSNESEHPQNDPNPQTPGDDVPFAEDEGPEPEVTRHSSRKAMWLAMGAVALALGLIWLAPGVGHFDEPSSTSEISGDPDDAKATGQVAPMHFTLKDMNGADVNLASFKGKVVLINFWATWCPPCLEEMPAMERLYRQHREVGFTLVAVSVDADSKLVAPFVTAHKFTFPVALDPSMSMANTYGVRALPSTFIVARDGTLAALAIGPRHWDNDAAHSLIEGLAR